jgi:hypothetical protein
VVLKLPVLLVNVTGLAQVVPVPVVLNVAVTERAAVIDVVQGPVPVHAPLQPANVDPLAAAAVSVTDVPLAKFALHVVPQFTPVGAEVTVPAPVPAFVTLSANVAAVVLKVAVTLRAAVIDVVQVPVPVHAPLQPANVDPLAAAAVSVTDVPLAKFALHVVPQLTPAGDEVTVPAPVPAFVTLNANVDAALNVAVTARAAVMDTVQAPVPVHAPLQPVNVEPLAAAAESVTDVPLAKFALHVVPQLTPAGDEVTVPAPLPAFVTASANVVVELLNVAVTARAAVIETVQAPVPVHAPLHPANDEPLAAAGVRVTEVPLLKLALQVVPQLIPAGAEVTVPAPVPFFVTARLKEVTGPETKGEIRLPPITVSGMPGPSHATAK